MAAIGATSRLACVLAKVAFPPEADDADPLDRCLLRGLLDQSWRPRPGRYGPHFFRAHSRIHPALARRRRPGALDSRLAVHHACLLSHSAGERGHRPDSV